VNVYQAGNWTAIAHPHRAIGRQSGGLQLNHEILDLQCHGSIWRHQPIEKMWEKPSGYD
jgi:hypothetical protein